MYLVYLIHLLAHQITEANYLVDKRQAVYVSTLPNVFNIYASEVVLADSCAI